MKPGREGSVGHSASKEFGNIKKLKQSLELLPLHRDSNPFRIVLRPLFSNSKGALNFHYPLTLGEVGGEW